MVGGFKTIPSRCRSPKFRYASIREADNYRCARSSFG
jgi:hypothetical protein